MMSWCISATVQKGIGVSNMNYLLAGGLLNLVTFFINYILTNWFMAGLNLGIGSALLLLLLFKLSE